MIGAVLFCLVSSCLLAVSMSAADCLMDVLAGSTVQPSCALLVGVECLVVLLVVVWWLSCLICLCLFCICICSCLGPYR